MIKYVKDYTALIHVTKANVNASKQKIVYYFDGKIETVTFADSSEFDDAVAALDGFLVIGTVYYNKNRLSIATQTGAVVTYDFLGNVTINHQYDDVSEADSAIAELEDSFVEINGKWYNGVQLVVANTNPSSFEITYDFGGEQIKVAYADSTEFDDAIAKLENISGMPGGGGGSGTKKVATPRFSPAAGGVPSGTTVTITCATEGAVIHYTTDGTAPTASSPTYSSPIAITADTTIKAIAVKTGMDNSSVASASYTIVLPKVANPTFTPSAGEVLSGTTVTITCATAGADIYYTTDGSTPSDESTKYTAPIEITAATTIKAIGIATDYQDSSVVTAAYTIGQPTAEAPTFVPNGGEVSKGSTVTLSTTTPGGVIHYTTDGSTPTASSPVYEDPIAINANTTIKALTIADGYKNSSVVTKNFTVPAVTLYRYIGMYNMVDDGEGDVDPAYQLTSANASTLITGLSWFEENVYNAASGEASKLTATTRAWGTPSSEKPMTSNAQAEVGYQIVYAYPKSLGELTKVTNAGFDSTNSYTHVTMTFDGEEYYVYFLTDPSGRPSQTATLSFS